MAHELPPLPYGYDTLEPHLDAKTVEIHHDKHHQAYTDKFNAALEGYPELQEKSPEELLKNLDQIPDDIRGAVQNHGGGYLNHKLFWETMGPDGGGEPEGELMSAIEKAFEDFESFKEKYTQAAGTHFASGWAWLSTDKEGNLKIHTTKKSRFSAFRRASSPTPTRRMGARLLSKIPKSSTRIYRIMVERCELERSRKKVR